MENVIVCLPVHGAITDGVAFSLSDGVYNPLQRGVEQSLQVGSTVVMIDGYHEEKQTFINFFRVESDGTLTMLCEEQTGETLVNHLAETA